VGHQWRTSGDITPRWSRMLHNFDSAATRALYAKPGAWNDPDMLFIGHGDFDQDHLTEARSHFSLWAIINAPLFIGFDLRNAPRALLDIWGNADVVRVNQDALGHQGVIAYASDDVQIIVKTLTNGMKAVAVFNRGLAKQEVNLTAAHLKFAANAPITLRDLWDKKTLAPFTGETSFVLEPRQTLLFEARGERRLKDGVYLSETPADVNVAVDGVVAPELDPVVHRMAGPWSGTRDTGERPAYAGWGGAQADATPYDQALQIAGRRFDTGIGILSGSRLEVRNQGYRKFSAVVGVDDSTRNVTDKVEFLVYGNGKLLARSGDLGLGEAKAIEADIEGSQLVELVVRARAGLMPAVVSWGDASLR
jgi:hypothetical protein